MALKIIFNPVDSEATGCQRIIYPLMALKEKYNIDYEILNTVDARIQLRTANVLYLQCLIGPQQRPLIEHCQKNNIKIIIDYDDNFAEAPKNVIDRFGLSKEAILENWKYYLNNADLITVPCKSLSEEVKVLTSKRVVVLPNLLRKQTYIEFKDYDPFDDLSEIRILYSCSESHLEDFKFISSAMSWIGYWYPNVRILSNGGLNFTYINPNYKGKASHISKVSYGAYYDALKKYKPHIFLAPLLANKYNQCRSDLKFWQAGLLKSAFVGSRLNMHPETYEIVKDRETGILCSNSRLVWFWKLRELINDVTVAKKLGISAYAQLKDNLLEDHIQKWYQELCKLSTL